MYHHHFSVIVTVCRGPCALGIYSTHGTPSFMHPLWLQKRNSGCILPLSYPYLFYVQTRKFTYIIIHSGWSLAWIFTKQRVKYFLKVLNKKYSKIVCSTLHYLISLIRGLYKLLFFSYLWTKTYVVDTHWKCLNETVPMSCTTNVFMGQWKIWCFLWNITLLIFTIVEFW